ncbi:MAG: hypothetical protein D6704_04770 [Nitrospirae bacterium]|nr:MAG: hypothetical protein D6704_04770 [Nitrospirota bacterium]
MSRAQRATQTAMLDVFMLLVVALLTRPVGGAQGQGMIEKRMMPAHAGQSSSPAAVRFKSLEVRVSGDGYYVGGKPVTPAQVRQKLKKQSFAALVLTTDPDALHARVVRIERIAAARGLRIYENEVTR